MGFTAVYSQTWPSAALAYELKKRNPELKVMIGGASCEGVMGPAILKAFPWIDVVVRGEAENLVAELVRSLAESKPLTGMPGVCYRVGKEIIEASTQSTPVLMDHVPMPNYDEYFDRLAGSMRLHSQIVPRLPIESSRGCWWGEKHHCTFCGLNGEVMLFRSKSAQKVLDELMTLSSKHGVLDFTAVDNILDPSYFKSLMPSLAESGKNLSLFYETKANLSHEQVALLKAAGVDTIQPGIESLNTHVLQLMDKGVTALQNVRLLKWCAEFSIHVVWNLLHGFPGETREDYEEIAELMPSLEHLTPPNLSKLAVYRFSPHFEKSEQYGLVVDGPLPFYSAFFKLDPMTASDLAHSFRYHQKDLSDPNLLLGAVPQGVELWRKETTRSYRMLTYREGPGFLQISDSRASLTGGGGVMRYSLDDLHARIYLACDGIASIPRIQRELKERDGLSISAEEIKSLLDSFIQARLMMEEDGKYLSLAVPFTPRYYRRDSRNNGTDRTSN